MKRTKSIENDIDIIGSIEFDLSESLKDLFYQIKTLRKDVDKLKKNKNKGGQTYPPL